MFLKIQLSIHDFSNGVPDRDPRRLLWVENHLFGPNSIWSILLCFKTQIRIDVFDDGKSKIAELLSKHLPFSLISIENQEFSEFRGQKSPSRCGQRAVQSLSHFFAPSRICGSCSLNLVPFWNHFRTLRPESIIIMRLKHKSMHVIDSGSKV